MNDSQMNIQGSGADCKISLREMIGDFYNRSMAGIVVFVWAWAILMIAGAIWSAAAFFNVDNTQDQIMFAVIFLVLVGWANMIKVFAWQMIHRNGLCRKITRLEQKIDTLSEKLNIE